VGKLVDDAFLEIAVDPINLLSQRRLIHATEVHDIPWRHIRQKRAIVPMSQQDGRTLPANFLSTLFQHLLKMLLTVILLHRHEIEPLLGQALTTTSLLTGLHRPTNLILIPNLVFLRH